MRRLISSSSLVCQSVAWGSSISEDAAGRRDPAGRGFSAGEIMPTFSLALRVEGRHLSHLPPGASQILDIADSQPLKSAQLDADGQRARIEN
jgi:hypothetical protein